MEIKCWPLSVVEKYEKSPIRGLKILDVFTNKQLLDEVFVISRIIKVEVGVISQSQRLRLITLTEKKGSHVFASSLTAGNTKCANLTWLPLEIMHRGHTWHDYPWPWVSLTWLLYNLQLWRHRRWFRKFTVRFRPIRKEIVSSMYNNSYWYTAHGRLIKMKFNNSISFSAKIITMLRNNMHCKLNVWRWIQNIILYNVS